MPFIASGNIEELKGQPLKANGQCVRLLQEVISGMPHTSFWRPGEKVKGNIKIKKGTAIATFFNGRYPSNEHGNHAAIYLRQDAASIWVIDQFISDKEKFQKINNRPLHFGAPYPSNNGDLFYVIETEATLKK
jgi:hypothetical protein